MKPSTRRLVAYVTGRLANPTSTSSSVYDYAESRFFFVSGTVDDRTVQVFDHDAGAHFNGTGSARQFSLYHFGHGAHLSLAMEAGGRSSGYDYDSGSHYNAQVNGNRIVVYDYEEGGYFNYSI